MAIEKLANNALNKVVFNIRKIVNGVDSGGGSSARSNIIFHKCGKKVRIDRNCRSKGFFSSGNSSKNSIDELPEWVTNKGVVSYKKYLSTSTMTYNSNKYNWFTYFNHGNHKWIFN